MYFRNIVLSASAVAIVAGLFLSLYQEYLITPIILDSEVYEVTESLSGQVWSPEGGVERLAYSLISNVLVCFAYALVLLSAMAFQSSLKVAQGFFWGGSAYICIFVAPALGLPPEIPGMEAAYLEGRQAWWLLTVLLTAAGLWLIAFSGMTFKGMGAVLLVIPHVMGAPQAELHGFANTDQQAVKALTTLWHHFIVQTSLANGLLWLIIGMLSAPLADKFILSLKPGPT